VNRMPSLARLEAARTHCPQGHPYSEENTYVNRGHRFCRTCHRKHSLDYLHRKAKARSAVLK
jgi:hypothetical protein